MYTILDKAFKANRRQQITPYDIEMLNFTESIKSNLTKIYDAQNQLRNLNSAHTNKKQRIEGEIRAHIEEIQEYSRNIVISVAASKFYTPIPIKQIKGVTTESSNVGGGKKKGGKTKKGKKDQSLKRKKRTKTKIKSKYKSLK